MATSKVGKDLCRRRVFRNVDRWKRKELLSNLCVHYHMGHTLESMGFKLVPYPCTKGPASNTQEKPASSGIASRKDKCKLDLQTMRKRKQCSSSACDGDTETKVIKTESGDDKTDIQLLPSEIYIDLT